MLLPESALYSIHDRTSLVAFLQTYLDWPVAPEDTLTMAGPQLPGDIPTSAQISRLVPFRAGDPFPIMLVEFEAEYRRADLREILRNVRAEMRKRAGYGDRELEEIVFFCVTAGYDAFRFVRYEEQTGRQPIISVFGWERRQPGGVRTILEYNLPALKMPPANDHGEPDWAQARWGEAWDVERVTREFCREYRATFEAVEQMIEIANPAPGTDWRLLTQRLFNRLMFIRFLNRRGWLRFDAFRDYLATLFTRFSGVVQIPGAAFERITDGLFARWNFTLSESTPLDVEVAVDPEMLGKVFEQLVTGRHASGSYYTPRGIVAFMCREALKHYLTAAGIPAEAAARFVDYHSTSGLRDTDFEVAFTALKRVRVVDPACGSGAYLLGMLHELAELRKLLFNPNYKHEPPDDYERKLDIIRRNLYGVDLDEFAVHIARLRLWLSLAVEYEGTTPEPLLDLNFNIEQGDSLAAPDESKTSQEDFDIVLANPPYLSTKHRFGQHNRKLLMQTYRTAKGQFDAYALFLERALALLCDTGCYAYIVPKPILTNSNMLPVRKMLDIANVIAIADPGAVFEAAVEPIIIVGHKKGKPGNTIKICTEDYFRGGQHGCRYVNAADVCTPAGTWNIAPSAADSRLIAQVANLPRLGDLFEIKRGVECGKKNATILQHAMPDTYPLLRGEDLSPFVIRFANYYIMRGNDNRIFKPKPLYDAPKLIIRRVANRLIAAIDLQGYHVLNTIYIARARRAETVSLEYVCALLNSRMMNDHFHAMFGNDDRLFPYVRKEQLDQLPIAIPAAQDEAKIVSLIRQISGVDPEQLTRLQDEIESIVQQIFANTAQI